jgi:hypothetical protein
MKDRFYTKLERVFNKFPKYDMKIMLGDFNAKICREEIFKQLRMSLHKISNNNGIRVVNLITSINLTLISTMILQPNIRKFTWTSSVGIIIKLTIFR